ncbi:metallophosphoesterase [Halovivax asiaticus JCM 14624]|uniref:DNA double-strand break repair protein Mre11 n=1 Tax=Halovivax asiaticus JCM 14624 TaxID=1227490 RepID=M0BUC3_9EURY|nr:DNA double-strand break repair protein Mre11 [Halovivax asiaticus]ELZ13722.1 metallophosphoesterase [Halovivax asiaticus JCM 14624]
MTRVIHTGDTHIGYQQYNSPERRTDFLSAFRAVTEDAIDDVDAVIHAGDLFHDRRPGLVDLQGTIDVLRSLDQSGIPFLAIVGNHETKRDAQWLDLFADLGLATRLGRDPVVVDDVAFYGLDYVPESRRDALTYDFSPVPDEASSTALVAHGLFEPFAHATWDTEAVLEESSVDFDAVLLGDNHAPGTETVTDTWVTYCGSTERASAAERDARGYNLVSFEDDVSIRRRAISGTREFVFVDVELAADEGADRVRERLSQHDVDGAVVIVTIEGDGEPISPAPIEEYALDRGALVARANDRRDLPDEADELQVSFADPDAAVTDRLRDLDLSPGALTIDATVRDDTVADSTVRETVERRVRDALHADGLDFTGHPSIGDADVDDSSSPPEGNDTEDYSPQESTPASTSEHADSPNEPAHDGDNSSTSVETPAAAESDDGIDAADDDVDGERADETAVSSDIEPAGGNSEDSDAAPEEEVDSDDDGSGDDSQVSIGDFA